MEIAEALQVRLAAAGLAPPADARERERLERDLAVHLARLEVLAAEEALLGPGAPPYTDPTRAAGPAQPR
jgi:hypothetical protein